MEPEKKEEEVKADDDKKDKKQKVVKLPDSETTIDGTHCYQVIDTKFEIDKRYEIIDPIG